MRGSAAVLVCVGLGRQTGGLPGLLQCASGPCVVGRADVRPDTKGCRTARPLPMGRALPWSLSDADRGVTSDQRRRWRAGRRARVRRLSRQSRAVRQLHALLMPSRQLRGGLPAHGTRRSNDVGFLRIRHPHVQIWRAAPGAGVLLAVPHDRYRAAAGACRHGDARSVLSPFGSQCARCCLQTGVKTPAQTGTPRGMIGHREQIRKGGASGHAACCGYGERATVR